MTAAPLTSTDPRWADAATVHAIAAVVDLKRPCMQCGTALYEHPGELAVIPDEVDPETPAIFGSRDCAQRWWNRVPAAQPRRVEEVRRFDQEVRDAFRDRDLHEGRQGPIALRFEDGLLVGSALCGKAVPRG